MADGDPHAHVIPSRLVEPAPMHAHRASGRPLTRRRVLVRNAAVTLLCCGVGAGLFTAPYWLPALLP